MKNVNLVLLALMVTASCGKSPTVDRSVLPDARLGDVQAEAKVCPEGGTFHFGQVTLTVPEGAVEKCTTVLVEEWGEVPKGSLGPAYHAFLDEGVLLEPVELTVRLGGELVPSPYRYADLEVARLEESKWQVLVDGAADVEAQSVSTLVESLGIFGLVPRVRIDILFASEDGIGMCDFRRVLAHAAPEWIRTVAAGIPHPDIQVAAVTRSAWTGEAQFSSSPALVNPPACTQRRAYACQSNLDCQAAFGTGWECKAMPEDGLYNFNGSVNTSCVLRCDSDSACCAALCTGEECGQQMSCPSPLCTTDADGCPFECRNLPPESSGCAAGPLTSTCSADVPPIIAFVGAEGIDSLATLPCNLQEEYSQSYVANLDAVFRATLRSLDPSGPNAAEASEFVRSDAFLLVVFLAYDDECSIASEFASPNYKCESDDDCLGEAGTCKVDTYFSNLHGSEVRLCHGLIKKDYSLMCGLLEEYQGLEHHGCAYDLNCADCAVDEDCPAGWYCKQGKKCRPQLYSISNIASYQTPPGTPIFSLLPVSSFRTQLEGLKDDPSHLLVGAIVGDGVVQADDAESLISQACLDDELLVRCDDYQGVKAEASAECLAAPSAAGCETLYLAKLECIRECFLASFGDPDNSSYAKNSYVCNGPYGRAAAGSRYARLVESMGGRGSLTSYCHPEGIPRGLERIGEMVLTRVLGAP